MSALEVRTDMASLYLHDPTRGIDAEMLERMARIARDLPGHTVSLDSAYELPPDSEPVLRIDGVSAEEVLERCFDDVD